MKIDQKGFTVVEGLLIVIALTLIGFTGFYVYNANKDDQKTTNNQTSAVKEETKPAAKPVEYKEFKNLGVKIKLDDAAKKFTYSDNEFGISVVSSELKALTDKDCTSDSGGDGLVATVSRVQGKYVADDHVGSSLLKQFPTFALSAGSLPAGFICGTSTEATQRVSNKTIELSTEAKNIFKNAEQL